MAKIKSIPVLMYHHISPNSGLVTIAPQTFFLQMQALVNAGYQSVTAAEFSEFLQTGSVQNKTSDKLVLITFDDGYLDNYFYAFPILRFFDLHAVMFIVTKWIKSAKNNKIRKHLGFKKIQQQNFDFDTNLTPSHDDCKKIIAANKADKVIITWQEINKMQQNGTFEFHCHTHTHQRFDKIFADDANAKKEALFEDLEAAKKILQQNFDNYANSDANENDFHLCWPQGYYDADYVEVANIAGFNNLYTCEPGANLAKNFPKNANYIKRIVTKEKSGKWLTNRLFIYKNPTLAKLYCLLKNK